MLYWGPGLPFLPDACVKFQSTQKRIQHGQFIHLIQRVNSNMGLFYQAYFSLLAFYSEAICTQIVTVWKHIKLEKKVLCDIIVINIFVNDFWAGPESIVL